MRILKHLTERESGLSNLDGSNFYNAEGIKDLQKQKEKKRKKKKKDLRGGWIEKKEGEGKQEEERQRKGMEDK